MTMGEQGLLCRYVGPVVVDYGNLVEITAAAHLLMGAADISDLSFSSPHTPAAGGGPGVEGGGSDPPASAGTLTSSGGTSGGGTSGSGASGGGTAGGGHLPFTGLAAGAVAAIGSALAAGGSALRRATRRRQP
jgi:hypothetical protein